MVTVAVNNSFIGTTVAIGNVHVQVGFVAASKGQAHTQQRTEGPPTMNDIMRK